MREFLGRPEGADTSKKLQNAPPSQGCYAVRKPLAALCVALGMVLLGLNIWLLHQNNRMHAAMARHYGLQVPRSGVYVPPIHGTGLDGQATTVTFGQDPRRSLLFVFSPTCHYCDLNWMLWKKIAGDARAGSVRLVYINLASSLSVDYAARHEIGGRLVLARLDPATERALGLHLTPQTILLSSEGKVEAVWSGLLDRDKVTAILKAVGQ
jgi:hypothetical protein